MFNVKNRSTMYIHMLFKVFCELVKLWRKTFMDKRKEEQSLMSHELWTLSTSFTIVMSLKKKVMVLHVSDTYGDL